MKPEEFTSLLEHTSKEDVQNLIKYLTVQKAEAHAIANGKTNKEIINAYLEKMAELDPAIAAVFPTNDAGKTIDDCIEWIDDNALKMVPEKTGTQCVRLPSFTVFEWAERYFLDPEIKKFEKPKFPTAPKTYQSKKKTLKELQAAKEFWEKENSRKAQEWEIANNAKIDQFEREHALDLFKPENPHIKNINPYLTATFPQQEELDKLLNAKDQPAETTSPAENPEEVPEDAVGELDNPEDNDPEEPEARDDDGTTELDY